MTKRLRPGVRPKNKLPACVRVGDLKWPRGMAQLSYKEHAMIRERGLNDDLRLWWVLDWGWVIPVLLIRNAGRRNPGMASRQYAIRVDTGELVRVGIGPHVGEQVRVYLSKRNVKRLEPLLALALKGAVAANQARDRRSTRALRRLFR